MNANLNQEYSKLSDLGTECQSFFTDAFYFSAMIVRTIDELGLPLVNVVRKCVTRVFKKSQEEKDSFFCPQLPLHILTLINSGIQMSIRLKQQK